MSYTADDDRFGDKRRPTNLSDTRQRLVEACVDYVFNSLPTHLIRVADMTMVTQNEIWDAERSRIDNILDEELREMLCEHGLESEITNLLERSLCEKYAANLFKFAIFSHRWGDREPLFQEMSSKVLPRPIPSGPGYDKLHHLCEKAQTDFQCRYVWSDTCCINKESSSELEEAIRSMYRWYSLANVCIVHLGQSLTVDDFERDAWFTRGWTLQELLAPKMIRFYGKDWNPICPEVHEHGDKDNEMIAHAIARVTGIPGCHLQSFLPSCELVAEIMSWSATRKTTRIEDRAYSLLGLLNISIPIAYGEGHRAFYRLMIALANECLTPFFFAWVGPHSDYSIALPASPACYARIPESLGTNLGHITGRTSYEVTKFGVMVKVLLLSVHPKLTRKRGGIHVGITWFFDEDVPLEPFMVRAGSGGSDSLLHTLLTYPDTEWALGVVDFERRGPDSDGELGNGNTYLGVLAQRNSWGWEKLTTDVVIQLDLQLEYITRPVESILLLHSVT